MNDPNWICERCGDCCRYVAGEDEWTYATLTDEQKESIKERMEPVERGCKALVMIDGKSTCIGQYLFGIGAKPPGCASFTYRCGMTAKVKELIINRTQRKHHGNSKANTRNRRRYANQRVSS